MLYGLTVPQAFKLFANQVIATKHVPHYFVSIKVWRALCRRRHKPWASGS
uniref:Uncharacterized protein orf49 n=1 Tax=Dichelobacter nodosus TaxID=870 RepID=Q46535_DICNO|nr:unknown [Dichelobacter nodosus]